MHAGKRSARPGFERLVAVGILVTLGAAGIGAAVTMARGMREMATSTWVGLISSYFVVLVAGWVGAARLRRRNRRLARAEDEFRTLVEQAPVVVYVDALDDQNTSLYLSPQYEELMGYTPEEVLADPDHWEKQLHPNDRDWVLSEFRRTNGAGEPFRCEYRMMRRDGAIVWVRDEASLVRSDDGAPLYWQGVLFDISTSKLVEEAVLRRDAILDSAAFAADRFLKATSWRECVDEVLARLGEATNVSRVYMYENREDESGRLLMSQTFEWCAKGIPATIDHLQNTDFPYEEGFERWIGVLSAGGTIHGPVKNLPKSEREDYESEGVISAAVVPLFAGDEWCGLMGFDDCRTEREWSHAEMDALKVAAGALGGAIGRERGERLRREAEKRYRTLVEQIPAITYIDIVDESMSTAYVSPQIESLLGITPKEYVTDPRLWEKHLHPDDKEGALAQYLEGRDSGQAFTFDYRLIAKNGRTVWFRDSAVVVHGQDGEPAFVQGVMLDITEGKEAEEQVEYLAYHDKLTCLPNRAMFEEMLDLAMARARRSDSAIAVIYTDLDNFKLVNDSLGHEAGDELLCQLAERLSEATRETDLVARQGGDEFLLLLSDLPREPGEGDEEFEDPRQVAEAVANRVHHAMKAPFSLGGSEFYVSASIGISMFPQDAEDARQLLKNADTAMYQSKKAGPGGQVVFSTRSGDSLTKLSFATRLRRAVESENWVLHYQPIVELDGGKMVAVEALLRWQDPNGGLIPPGEFIPLAEEMGLIEVIGDWVVEELCRQHVTWMGEGVDLDLSFNLSPRQLWQPDLALKIRSLLAEASVDPSRIIVEITESTAMTDPERIQRILWDLHGQGLRVAIDDFGTGYSSLSRLQYLPVDILKIDRSFVRDLPEDRHAAGIVSAIVQLADSLGVTSLAEAVETPEQLEYLLERGCRLGQGYHFARPLPPEEVVERYAAEEAGAKGDDGKARGSEHRRRAKAGSSRGRKAPATSSSPRSRRS